MMMGVHSSLWNKDGVRMSCPDILCHDNLPSFQRLAMLAKPWFPDASWMYVLGYCHNVKTVEQLFRLKTTTKKKLPLPSLRRK